MSQAAFLFDAAPNPVGARAARPGSPPSKRQRAEDIDDIAFEIGWDFARHRLTPPVAHLHADNPVRQGWSAARAAFGARTLRPTLPVRQWLELRLAAWQSGCAFESVQVTPHFIAQLQVTHCPVTGIPLATGNALAQSAHPPLPARLNPQAAYAAGNLAMLSDTARTAAEGLDWRDALVQADEAEGAGEATRRGLTPSQWRRLAGLMSLTTPLSHAQAAALPLLVLPPNRVRVLNAVQALQVMLTLQFCKAGYARRLVALAALMPSSELRQAFQVFMHTMLARRLAAPMAQEGPMMRAAMEQAWADTLVQRRWLRLASRLTAADCEQLLQRAAQRGLMGPSQRWQAPEAAVDGWALESAGMVEPAATAARSLSGFRTCRSSTPNRVSSARSTESPLGMLHA